MFLWGVSGSTPTSGIFYVPTNPASRGDVGDMCVLVFFGFPALLVKVAHFLLGCFLLLWEGGSFALLVPVGTYSFAPHPLHGLLTIFNSSLLRPIVINHKLSA